MNQLPLWLVVIGAIVPIIGLLLAYGGYRQSVRRDRLGNTNGKSFIELSMTHDPRVDLCCICAPFNGLDIQIPVRLWLRNKGTFTARDIRVNIEIPRRFYCKERPPFTSSAVPEFVAKVAANLESTFSYACTVPELHPGQDCDVNMRLEIKPARARADALPHVAFVNDDGGLTHRTIIGGTAVSVGSDVVDVSLLDKDAFVINCAVYQRDARQTTDTFAFRVHDRCWITAGEYLKGVNVFIHEQAAISGTRKVRQMLVPGWSSDRFKLIEVVDWPDSSVARRSDGPAAIITPTVSNVTLGTLSEKGFHLPGLDVEPNRT